MGEETSGSLGAEESKFTNGNAEDLGEDELAEFREMFNLVDRDGGGSISNQELGELMDTLGINATQDEIDLMIQEIDQDSNGEVDFEEFVAVMSRKVNATYTEVQVRNAFKLFEDKNNPGQILPDVLEEVLLKYVGSQSSREQIHELVCPLETDANGLFNFERHVERMMQQR